MSIRTRPRAVQAVVLTCLWALLLLIPGAAVRADTDPFVETVAKVRPTAVAIGSYHFRDTPSIRFFGSGFVVCAPGADPRAGSNLVVTNAHVVEAMRSKDKVEDLRVFFPDATGARSVEGQVGRVIGQDTLHDVALIRFEGPPQGGLELELESAPRQGMSVGVIGYPIGTALGLVPAAHRGVVSAVVPAVLPLPRGVQLTPELAEAIRRPYDLLQLDLVVFPGHSGSPVFDAGSGKVVGIINKTLAGRTREHLLEQPTGIAYAVPVRWIHELIVRNTVNEVTSDK